MFKFICGIVCFIFVAVAVFGSDKMADTAMEWMIGFIFYGLIALAVLWVINLFLSMFQ